MYPESCVGVIHLQIDVITVWYRDIDDTLDEPTLSRMSCRDLPDWYLRNRIAVVDVRSAAFRSALDQALQAAATPDTCLRRLVASGRIRRIRAGLYVAHDPARQTPPIAIASGVFAEIEHYVTTDAALAFHGLIDQPIPIYTVVLPIIRRAFKLDAVTALRPVSLRGDMFRAADAYRTTVDGYTVRVASREQSVVDALAEPRWMAYGDLLPEVLAAFTPQEVERLASRAIDRSTAAAQRLGYLLEDGDHRLPAALRRLRPVRAVKLRPQRPVKGRYSTRWRVYG